MASHNASQLGLPSNLRHYHDYGARPPSRSGRDRPLGAATAISSGGASGASGPSGAPGPPHASRGHTPAGDHPHPHPNNSNNNSNSSANKTEAAVAEAERRADLAEAAQRAVEGMLVEQGREVMELNHHLSALKARK